MEKKIKSQIQIFIYKDYRDFLADKINERKKLKLNSSYRWLSSRAGFTSPNFLHLVVKKKRHLSGNSIDKVALVFSLKKEELKYFRSLVYFNKSKTISEKEHYAQELLSYHSFNKSYPLSRDQFEYYSEWYHIPIREILTLKNQDHSAQSIADSLIPTIGKLEVEKTLLLLTRLGLIKNNNEQYHLDNQSIETGENFSNYGVVSYHKKMMQLGAEALDRFTGSDREVSSVTIGLSVENFKKIKELVIEFRSKLMKISEEDHNKERIYQLNFQVFPLTIGKVGK